MSTAMAALSSHIPVMTKEALEALQVHPGGNYVDCTVGGGGHAIAILKQSLPGGRLLGIDADPEAIEAARERLAAYDQGAIVLENDNFSNLEAICSRHSFWTIDSILFDLLFVIYLFF